MHEIITKHLPDALTPDTDADDKPKTHTISDSIKLFDHTNKDEFSEVRVEYLEQKGFNVIEHGHERFFYEETAGWHTRKEWTETLETLLREEFRSTFEKVDKIRKKGTEIPLKDEQTFEQTLERVRRDYKKHGKKVNLSKNNTHREHRYDMKNGEKYREAFKLLKEADEYAKKFGGFTTFHIVVEAESGDIPLSEVKWELHKLSWKDKRTNRGAKKTDGIIREETRKEANEYLKMVSERVPELIEEIQENPVVENDPHFQESDEPDPLGSTYKK